MRLRLRYGWALVTGLGLTCLAVWLHINGATQRLELLLYDFNVRHFSNLPASDRILHIDIDDDALERVGSWPWPRDVQADLLGMLNELGADQIVMDIVFSEPKPPRLPLLERDTELPFQGELSQANLVYPDAVLADTLARSSNVYLAMFYQQQAASREWSTLQQQLAAILREDFSLDATALARQLSVSAEAVRPVIAGVKRTVAIEKVDAFLAEHPGALLPDVHTALLSTPFDHLTADREDIVAAYQQVRNMNALRERLPEVPSALQGKIPIVDQVVPPLEVFTHEVARSGFVTFTPELDGLMRKTALIAEWDGRLIEQLGFAAMRDAMGIDLDQLSIDASGDLLVAADHQRRELHVPLDREGRMLINWHVMTNGWRECFEHVPATALLQITDARNHRRQNDQRRTWALNEAVRLVSSDAVYHSYLEDLQQDRTEQVERQRVDAADLIVSEWEVLRAEGVPVDAQKLQEYERFRDAAKLVQTDIPALDQADAQINAQCEAWLALLKPQVQGRTCYVGYTATAVADVIATPPYERLPGVLVHSQIANGFVQQRFLRDAPMMTQVGVIILMGVGMTLLAVVCTPVFSVWMMMLLIGVSFVFNSLFAFRTYDLWQPMATPLLLTFVVWAAVVLLRLLVTDRQRRRFVKAVAQYVSPAMAKQMVESDTPLDLTPCAADMTCLFTDVTGFTPISERLGPAGTRSLLNPYLEQMSEVLHRRDALINKFMGDGVFAFFNPPILPCDDHEVAGCDAALDCLAALQQLKYRYRGHALADEFKQLSMRIGIAAGPVFVGDYGSDTKLDYTCVGDTVNLAARLESANKQFGTSILISEAVAEVTTDCFVLRHLGRVQVVGQAVAVAVYELVGRAGDVPEDVRREVVRFNEAAAAYRDRDWDRTIDGFSEYLDQHPGDIVATRYLGLCRQHRASPPGAGWSGVLELTQK